MLSRVWTAALVALLVPLAVVAQDRSPLLYDPNSARTPVPSGIKAPAARASSQDSACTLITFEGLGELGPIPTFHDISLPNWLSIIGRYEGGNGNFANEPSPVTVAFWLYGDQTTQTIQIPKGASTISFGYSSYTPIIVTAYNSKGDTLTSTTGAANFDTATYLYDKWAPLQVTAPTGTKIASLKIVGNKNQTAIDNLNVCQAPLIDSVEITQAIQQYQTLDDLQASLKSEGEPPVPIIAGKPAVMRVYFEEVEDVTNVTVRLSGVSSDTKTMSLQTHCPDKDQRSGDNGCQSMDFYFTPPSGNWQATLDTLDDSQNVIHTDVLSVNSRSTNGILLHGVTVCDAKDAAGKWLCADGSNLLGDTTLLSKLAPTQSVSLDVTNNVVRQDSATFVGDKDNSAIDYWWEATVKDVDGLYGLFGGLASLGSYTGYFGQIRPGLAGGTGGMAHGIPSHGAASRTSVIRLGSETKLEVVAHETGHMLGLKHTNTDTPSSGGVPGCYNLAGDASTDWPFGNNYIQSTSRLEYGFDVANRVMMDPNRTFDLMSYCVPRWVSPQRYKTMIETLGGGSVSSPSAVASAPIPSRAAAARMGLRPETAAAAPFWQVRGVIQNFTVQFAPLFQMTIPGDSTAGSGTYSLVELDGGGNGLFTRFFTPEAPGSETAAADLRFPPGFSQAIPVTAGAAAIVVRDPNGLELGRIALGGAAPAVTVVSPGAGFIGAGTETVSWTVQNVNGAFTSRVLYSADRGVTWALLGDLPNGLSLPVNFDSLPGSNAAAIQVLVSDGVRTGAATSNLFTVPRKLPTAISIDTPSANWAQPAADPVYLSGEAYDPDDGVLSGASLVWTSNLQGQLGTGSPLSVRLRPGNHTIELKATDSDGNSISATTNAAIGDQPPAVTIQATPLDTSPTTCETATVNAQPGVSGLPLSLVQVSLDGGVTYSTIPLTSLPFTFTAPGSGFFELVARAYDGSGQSTASEVTFLTRSTCKQAECSVSQNFNVDIRDVQLMINEALGAVPAIDDLNGDKVVNILDVQIETNAALNLGCSAK